jgi:hypothetical protein
MSQEKKCNSCKKGLSNTQIGLVFLSFLILGTSIYGTYSLVLKLISIFF